MNGGGTKTGGGGGVVKRVPNYNYRSKSIMWILWRSLTVDPAGCPRDNVLPIVQFPDVLSDIGATDAGMTLHTHVVTQS